MFGATFNLNYVSDYRDLGTLVCKLTLYTFLNISIDNCLSTVRQFFLIGKYSISGSIAHNALRYYFGNLFISIIAMEKNNFVFSLTIYIATGID